MVFARGCAVAAVLALGAATFTAAGSAQAASGGLDPTFGNGGTVLTNLGVDAGGVQLQGNASAVSVLVNGDILVAGGFGLARYLPNGRLDSSFGVGGLAEPDFPNGGGSFPPALAVQPDGKYLWASNATTSDGRTPAFTVARFNTDGSLDRGFGTGGHATAAFANSNVQGAQSVLLQPDGKILLGGEVFGNSSYHGQVFGALARFNADGSTDPSFGTGGQSLTTPAAGPVTGLGEDASGDIFVLPAHAEFSPSGTQQSTLTPAPITGRSQGGAATFLPDGRSVMSTTVGINRNDTDVQVRRFTAAGALDPTFSNPPFDFTGQEGPARDSAGAVALTTDGKAVLGGSHFANTAVFGLGRINSNGSLDAGFGNNGVLTTTLQGDESITGLALQPDGKIVAVGSSEDNATGLVDVALARYTP